MAVPPRQPLILPLALSLVSVQREAAASLQGAQAELTRAMEEKHREQVAALESVARAFEEKAATASAAWTRTNGTQVVDLL